MKLNEYCGCCGKSVAETKSNSLVKKMRRIIPPEPLCTGSADINDEFAECYGCTGSSDINDEFAGCHVGEDYIQKCLYVFKMLGETEAAKILLSCDTGVLLIPSYECEDCAGLNDAQYNLELLMWI